MPRWLARLRGRAARIKPATLVGLACILIAAWLVFVPVGALLLTAFTEDTPYGPGAATWDNLSDAYSDTKLPGVLVNSFLFAGSGALLTILMGAAVAWATERTDMPGRRFFHTLTLLSFALPGLLTTMAWTLVLSPNIGWVNAIATTYLGLSQAPFNIYSMTGMAWVFATHYFPLAYLLLGPAFRAIDTRLEEAALMSGARHRHVLTRVTLPIMRPALYSAALLLFVRGLESFDVPRLIGRPARIDVLTTNIQNAIRGGGSPEVGIASALSLLLVAVCIVCVLLYRRAVRNAEAFATVTGKGYKPSPVPLGVWRWPTAAAIAALFVVTLGFPLFTLLWHSLFLKVAQPFVSSGGPVTLQNYAFVLSYPIFLDAVRTSVLLGVMAATAVVALTFVMAWIAQRAAPRLAAVIDMVAFVPIAIPSIIVGASVLFAYLIIPIPVYNTIWILLIAYVTSFLPYGMRFAAGGLIQIHRELEEAALTSGAGPLQVIRRILAPLLAPVGLSAWLYVFVLAVRELGASIMLTGPGTHVLGTISLTMWEDGGSYGTVCALGIIQILPLIAIVALLRRLEHRVARLGTAQTI